MRARGESSKVLARGLELALHSADERDIGFCYELMSHNMKALFDKNTPEKWSRAKFRSGFRPERITILLHEGMPIGFYDHTLVDENLYVHNIQLSDDYQNGVGTRVIEFIEQAGKKLGAKAIIGKVFTENLRVIGWLQKLGYVLGTKIQQENSYWVRKELQEEQ